MNKEIEIMREPYLETMIRNGYIIDFNIYKEVTVRKYEIEPNYNMDYFN